MKRGKLLLTGTNRCEEHEWEMLDDELTEIVKKKSKTGKWYCKVNNFGWMKRNGEKYFKASSGSLLLSSILPDTDCKFEVYNYGTGLQIVNYHHDNCTGSETYTLIPLSERTYANKSYTGKEKLEF